LWQEETDIDPGHILRFGDKDNFWEMGETGPCGPCSEIHFDLGEDVFERLGIPPVEGGVNSDSPRFIEIWNLVFIQYYRNEKGELEDLPQKHVDTGMGFERIVSVLQGQVSNYDTDLFAYIISGIASICGLDRQQQEQETEVALRVIADHVRALSFAIADGAMPGNEGRGYVLRRILRRAARYSRILGQDEPVLYRFVQLVVDTMADVFPELQQRRQHIETTIRAEEEQFNRTLDKGLQLFSQAAAELAKDGEKGIPGELVFKLYDTYGFPDDLTRVLAEEKGLDVDMEGYERAMQVQKDRARAAANFATRESDNLTWQVLQTGPGSDFTGYHHHREETRIQSYATSNGHVFSPLKRPLFMLSPAVRWPIPVGSRLPRLHCMSSMCRKIMSALSTAVSGKQAAKLLMNRLLLLLTKVSVS
jgi:alanyl-tRNA synthetase